MQILLRYKSDRAYGKVDVFIKWRDGTSKVWVPDSGIAEINNVGFIEYVEFAGMKHPQHLQVSHGDTIVLKKKN